MAELHETIEPLWDKVVVFPNEPEKQSAGGIVIPDTATEKPHEGRVLAVGPGRMLENGTLVPPAVKPGDTIVFSKYGGVEIELNGLQVVILDENAVLAIRRKPASADPLAE